MRHSTPYLALPLKVKKTTSVFCLFEDMISQRLLSFESSRHSLINLRADLLEAIFYFYNEHLFAEIMEEAVLSKTRIILSKEQESIQDFYQSIISKNKIDPTDIEMGQLGNSLFISAIYCLVETPILIFSLMDQVNSNTVGAINIFFINQNGTWREVFLDGILPYKIETVYEEGGSPRRQRTPKKEPKIKKEKKTLIFSKIKNNALNWLGLLEKAYSFAYGSCTKMLECLLEDILYDLTGAFIETLSISKMSNFELGDLLLKNFNKGSPMILAEEDQNERLNSLYQRQRTNNEWGIPIIDLRNTNTEYIIVKVRALKPLKKKKLMYNKGSNNWPPNLKTELGVKFDPENIVWLSLEEIKEMFGNLIICNINIQNFHKSIPFEFCNYEPLSFAIGHIHLFRSFNFGVTICQEDLREFENSVSYRYSKCTIFIAKSQQDESCLTYIGGTSGERRNVGINLTLEKGDYLVYFEIAWDKRNSSLNTSKRIKMNIYSDSDCSFKILSNSTDLRKNVLTNIFSSIANTQKLQKYLSDTKIYVKNILDNISVVYGTFLGFYFVIVKNSILFKEYYKMSIQVPIEGSFFADTTLQDKRFNDKEIKLIMPPNKDLILIFRLKKKTGEHIKIIKPLKKIEPKAKLRQDYKLRPFDLSLIREEENSKSSVSIKLFFRPDSDVIFYVKKWGSMQQRVFDQEKIDVYVWFGAFEEGVLFLVENHLKDKVYHEKISFKIENLELLKDSKQKRVVVSKDFIEINIEGGKYVLMKWAKSNNNHEIYNYQFKHFFCIKT